MMAVLVSFLGLAGLFGFLLSVYFFSYRVKNLDTAWRLLGGIVGGLIMGSFTALVALLLLWPPFNIVLLIGVIGIFGVTVILTFSGKKDAEELQVASEALGRDADEDCDVYDLDVDISARP